MNIIHKLLLLPLLSGTTLFSQAPPQSPLAFEVASVRVNTSGDTRSSSSVQPGGRYTATNVTLRGIVRSAYGVQHDSQPEASPRTEPPDALTLFTALHEQLGLKLDSVRGRSKCSSSTRWSDPRRTNAP